MNNTQRGTIGIIVIVTIILIGIFLYLFRINTSTQPTPVVIPSNTPALSENQTPITPSTNIQIQSAMISFQDYAINHEDEFDYLCTSGGFINERNPELKDLSDMIVANRVIDAQTNQIAVTPDEAGITCLSNPEKWVLFSPLNETTSGNGAQYFCVDSSGTHAMAGFDREEMQCGN